MIVTQLQLVIYYVENNYIDMVHSLCSGAIVLPVAVLFIKLRRFYVGLSGSVKG